MCDDAEFDEDTLAADSRPDQQAALDLLGLQATHGPRDLGLRPARRPALHAVPPVQLDRPAARLARSGADRQLARDHAAHSEPRRGHAAAADRRRPTEALLHGRLRGHRVPVPYHPQHRRASATARSSISATRTTKRASASSRSCSSQKFEAHPERAHFPPLAGIREIESRSYYGAGYQDVSHRRPSIRNANKLLGWNPIIPIEASVERTLDFFLRDHLDSTVAPTADD